MLPYLTLLRSFSDQTGFRQFYAAHRAFYDEQITYYRDQVDVAGSLEWLQGHFPAVKPYDSTKVVFSPLVFGSQSLTTFSSNGFTEIQPHVNFPYYLPQFDDGLSPRSVAIRRGAILFTELNHGFINPTAEPLASQIAQIFGNRELWAAGKASDSYQSPQSLFNEYMNWALVSLYYADKADTADVEAMVSGVEDMMIDNRGFPQFKALNRFLMQLYRERPAGTTLADLYPQILAWSAAHQAASTN